MITKFKIFHSKNLYIFFLFLSLNIFFFSTTKLEGKAFDIDNINISRPFEIDFDKSNVIDEGFKQAFEELILLIISSSDQKKIEKIRLNEIRSMIETFSIKEEKFINETYFVNLGVSFNKKRIFNYLEKKNIFPSMPIKKKILFLPIIIDEVKKDLLVFSNNKIFNDWNNLNENFHLIEYILPTEDLEDLNSIKNKYEMIENHDFKEIRNKYYLKDSIIALIFKNEKNVRILSRININENTVLKNQTFSDLDINDSNQIKGIIIDLKVIYEDYWKKLNQVNTSIKLPLNIKIDSSDNSKISNFEEILNNHDLIYDFFITKLDKEYINYQIIFNGTVDTFLKSMNRNKLNFDTQNKVWILK